MRRRDGTTPDVWTAVADPYRWSILALLAERPRSVTEQCERLDLRQSTVSTHLAVLREAELVQARKRGYYNVYEIRPRTLTTMANRLRNLAEHVGRPASEFDEKQERRYRQLEEN